MYEILFGSQFTIILEKCKFSKSLNAAQKFSLETSKYQMAIDNPKPIHVFTVAMCPI